MRQLVKMEDLTVEEVYALIDRALALKKGAQPLQRPDLTVAHLFFENSTRTKHSFEMAAVKLGLERLHFDADHSSLSKGESLYDTCKTLEMLGCNILVIRHPQEAYYRDLHGLTIPIINGGDGSGEHPSQCLLDLMTLYEHFGRLDQLDIVIVGDIRNSRVARSNARMLARLGSQVRFVCPDCFRDPSLGPVVDFDQVIGEVDACMLLRVQYERHQQAYDLPANQYHQTFGLTTERYRQLKPQAIILHPAPVNRGMEIASHLVEAPKSRIFEQMANGCFMRQAILEKIIRENHL